MAGQMMRRIVYGTRNLRRERTYGRCGDPPEGGRPSRVQRRSAREHLRQHGSRNTCQHGDDQNAEKMNRESRNSHPLRHHLRATTP
jgi:hypothetical protein